MTHDTQELVEALRKIGGHGFPNWADNAADALIAQAEEIRVLRERKAQMEAALREVIDHCANTGRGNVLVNDRIYERVEETARAALAGKGEA